MFAIFVGAKNAVHRVGLALENRRAKEVIHESSLPGITSGLRFIRPESPAKTIGRRTSFVSSQLKDERQVRPEIRKLFAPVAVERNLQERFWSFLN
jgi:hypothetical protein